jgi:hypothetical protein
MAPFESQLKPTQSECNAHAGDEFREKMGLFRLVRKTSRGIFRHAWGNCHRINRGILFDWHESADHEMDEVRKLVAELGGGINGDRGEE